MWTKWGVVTLNLVVRTLTTRFNYFATWPQQSTVLSLTTHGIGVYLKVTNLWWGIHRKLLGFLRIRFEASVQTVYRPGSPITATSHARFEVRTKHHQWTLYKTAVTSRKTNEPCHSQPQSNKTHQILQTKIKAIYTVRHKTVNDCEKLWGLGFYTFQTLI